MHYPIATIWSCQGAKLPNTAAFSFLPCWKPCSYFQNPASTLRVSVAQLDAPAASPTLAPSSAPRTETMTAAPANALSSHQEVGSFCSTLNLSVLITYLVKHFYPPACKCPKVHFIFPLCWYKVTADLQLYIWVFHFMSLNLINSDFFPCTLHHFPTSGWWFEACGPSNLNGIYYPSSSTVVRYNGIKWYYWKGPNLMSTMTTMMVRPENFWCPGSTKMWNYKMNVLHEKYNEHVQFFMRLFVVTAFGSFTSESETCRLSWLIPEYIFKNLHGLYF